MSKVIRISEETFIRLQEHAEPLVDTPATVIERLLDFYEREQRNPERVQQWMLESRVDPLTVSRPPNVASPRGRYRESRETFGDFDYPPIVPSLFLIPATEEHIETTVARPVPYTKTERLILARQRIQLQRAIEGASTFSCYGLSESNRPVFESMRPGDYVLIMVPGSIELNQLARVVTKFESEDLGRELWDARDEKDEQPLSLIFALEDVQQINLDQDKLNKALGYSPRYSVTSPIRVDPKRLEPQLVKFGGVEGLLWDL